MTPNKLTLVQWLDDLCVRFIINAPPEDLESVHRIFFQVEEAQWFYEDFVRPLDPSFPALSLQLFSRTIFQHCHIFAGFTLEQHDAALVQFLRFKKTVPVRGAIMMNDDMDRVLLVKAWKGNNWSFPRGKIAKGESDLACAIREVYEETGYDLEAAGIVQADEENVPFVQHVLRDQDLMFFLFRGIPLDTPFAPRTRKEISKIQWHMLTDLPAYKKKQSYESDAQTAAVKAGKYYMVAPFLGRIKRWIKEERRFMRHQERTAEVLAPTQDYMPPEQMISDENAAFMTEDGTETEAVPESPEVEQVVEQTPTQTHYQVDWPVHSATAMEPSQMGGYSTAEMRSSAEMYQAPTQSSSLLSILRSQQQPASPRPAINQQAQSLLSIFGAASRQGESSSSVMPPPEVFRAPEQQADSTSSQWPTNRMPQSASTHEQPRAPYQADAKLPSATTLNTAQPLTLLEILRKSSKNEMARGVDANPSMQPLAPPVASQSTQPPEHSLSPAAQIPQLSQHQSGLLNLFSKPAFVPRSVAPSKPPSRSNSQQSNLLALLRKDAPVEEPVKSAHQAHPLLERQNSLLNIFKKEAPVGLDSPRLSELDHQLGPQQLGLLNLFRKGGTKSPAPISVDTDIQPGGHYSSPSASSATTVRPSVLDAENRTQPKPSRRSPFGSASSSIRIANHPFAGLPLSSPHLDQSEVKSTEPKAKKDKAKAEGAENASPFPHSPRFTVLVRPKELVSSPKVAAASPVVSPALPAHTPASAEDGSSPEAQRAQGQATPGQESYQKFATRHRGAGRVRGLRTPVVSAERADDLLSSFTRPKPTGRARLFDPMTGRRGRHASPRTPDMRHVSKIANGGPSHSNGAQDVGGASNSQATESAVERPSVLTSAPDSIPFTPTILRRPQAT